MSNYLTYRHAKCYVLYTELLMTGISKIAHLSLSSTFQTRDLPLFAEVEAGLHLGTRVHILPQFSSLSRQQRSTPRKALTAAYCSAARRQRLRVLMRPACS